MERYGIYDTKENCWIGNDDGPVLYDDSSAKGIPAKTFAQIAAQIMEKMLGYPLGRLRETLFDAKNLRLRDTVATKMEPIEALRRVEEGVD